jgi:hypothetical protein
MYVNLYCLYFKIKSKLKWNKGMAKLPAGMKIKANCIIIIPLIDNVLQNAYFMAAA